MTQELQQLLSQLQNSSGSGQSQEQILATVMQLMSSLLSQQASGANPSG
jgi:hypothetical protein